MTTTYKCPECDSRFEEDDVTFSRLYECSNCGEEYSREQTENSDARCPSCNKFGSRTDSKAGAKGKNAGDVPVCPDCENKELEEAEPLKECPFCDNEYEFDEMKEHLLNHHIDEVLDYYIENEIQDN